MRNTFEMPRISCVDDIAMTSSSGRPSVVYYFFVPVVSLMAANIVLFFLTSLIVNGYKSCWTGRCVTVPIYLIIMHSPILIIILLNYRAIRLVCRNVL